MINRATRTVSATMGVLVGLAGIDHGFFEMLQGNLAPNSMMIEAIGTAQRFWPYGVETALTVIPNLLISGILSIILGVLVIIWSITFIDRKFAAGVLLLLCIMLFLVGGGFAPIFMAVIASLAASQIHSPLNFWRAILPGSLRRFLASTWQIFLVSLVVLFVISVELAIFGWPLTLYMVPETLLSLLFDLGYIMIAFMLLSLLAGFAFDIQQHV